MGVSHGESDGKCVGERFAVMSVCGNREEGPTEMTDSEVARDFNRTQLEITKSDPFLSPFDYLLDLLCECGCGATVPMTAGGYATHGGAFLDGHHRKEARQPAPSASPSR
jgi:hypothetical protein